MDTWIFISFYEVLSNAIFSITKIVLDLAIGN